VCFETISKYRITWAKTERNDVRILTEWEHEVMTLVNERIACLKRKDKHRQSLQVLVTKSKYSEYLREF